MTYVYDDGGRAAAGFKSDKDCGIRAAAIALNIPYREAQRLLRAAAKRGKQGCGQISRGIYKEDFDSFLKAHGWAWHSAPKFEGRKARYSDLPKGRVIARMARHFAAVIGGDLRDTWDSSQKMVYGYWAETGSAQRKAK